MNSYINTNNLVKENNEGDSNLTISCNYNLLNNDNTVRWNGNEITLIKPYGLSNVKKICFRGFKGDLLPFTSIDLPKFRVEVVLTGYDVDTTALIGVDCEYGEKHKYDIDNNGNILLTFDKAWTYNAEEDNQLIYNIKEAVEEVNRRLCEMFPYRKTDYIYNITETWNENTQQKVYYSNNIRSIGINPGSYIVGIQKGQGDNNISLMYVNNNVESFTTYAYRNRHPWYSAVSWDKQIAVACSEYETGTGSGSTPYGKQLVWINTASGGAPTYTELTIDRQEGWDTRANYFNLFARSPSMVIGSVGGITSAILSPICRGTNQNDSNVIIARHDKRKYYLDFNKNISNDNILNVLACCDAYDKNGNPINNIIYMVCAYIPKGFTNDSYRVGLFEFDYTTLSQNGNTPTEVMSAKAETRLYQWYEFTEFMKFMQCGKETYKCYYMDIDGDGSDVGVWFVGSYMFRFGEMDNGLIPLPAWKLDTYKYLFQNKDNGNYYVLDMADNFGSAENLINKFNQFYIAGGFNIINNNDVHTLNISPPYLLKDFSTNSIVGIVQNPGYMKYGNGAWNPTYNTYLNEDHIKNSLMCETVYEIDLKSVAKYNNTEYNMVENVGGYATTSNSNFFKFDDNGDVLTSQITYEGNKALNMSLRIYTDPYYFKFATPIDYYVNTSESIIHPIVTPRFSTINKHVLNTVETLILLHYEYNNISLVSAQFPNIDGTIFYINEDSYVDFKTMAINNTSDGVRVKLLSNNEALSLTELRVLYGKLCVAIDWIQ